MVTEVEVTEIGEGDTIQINGRNYTVVEKHSGDPHPELSVLELRKSGDPDHTPSSFTFHQNDTIYKVE
jgi:hypothetical protein